jgi:hypothetical protein
MIEKNIQGRVGYFLSGLGAFLLHLPQIYHRGKWIYAIRQYKKQTKYLLT